ncbi:serine/threonine-protein kinase PCRK2-like [Bidens hawaiensis]|uniref:serine/threonine-protein kinase PCRK2-like n=1 Tax=Bidens hawaiensis TaxID=980011 RepID=UPI00404A9E53
MVFCCQCLILRHHNETSPEQENTLQLFTYAHLQKATKPCNQSLETGKSVYMAVIKSLQYPYNNINVAVKPVKRAQMGKRLGEIKVRLLGNIKHPNLVRLIGYCTENENNWFLVYEYSPKRSLDRHLSSLSWSMRLRIAKDAATGLAYLHEGINHEIIFKDFKLSNIHLDNQMNAKLSYFGFVRETPPQDGVTASQMKVPETKGYIAPEYVEKGRLTTKMDVWSYGVFLQELITGGLPVSEESLENNPECMRWGCCYACVGMSMLTVDPRLEGRYSVKSMQKVTSIANKCLVLDPKRRPKMSEVLKLVKEAVDLELEVSG